MARRRVPFRECVRLARGASADARAHDPSARMDLRRDNYGMATVIQSVWMWVAGVPGTKQPRED